MDQRQKRELLSCSLVNQQNKSGCKINCCSQCLKSTRGIGICSIQQKAPIRILGHHLAVEAYTDNKSVIESLNSTKLVDDRRLRKDITAISETVHNEKNTNVKWCARKNQLANCMTKLGACWKIYSRLITLVLYIDLIYFQPTSRLY